MKILIPVDGSELSRLVLGPVRNLFGGASSEFTLLRVAPEPAGIGSARTPSYAADGWSQLIPEYRSQHHMELAKHPVISSQVWEGTRADLADSMASDAQRLRDAGFRTAIAARAGEPIAEIVACAADGGFDLIVMATHGRTGLRRALMGSVAQGVLERSPVPVMLVREDMAGVESHRSGM